nr:accessory gland protein Acp62F [Drosophila takahashii]
MWKLEIFAVVGLIICSVINCYVEKIDCTINGTQADCPTACPETCRYMGKDNCLLICGGPCVCNPGYVINRDIPACVLRSDCPHDIIQERGGRRMSNFDCFSGVNTCSALKN